MKLGLSIKIDVSKIDKARIFEGKKGKYLDLTTFIDLDKQGEYGDNGFISQSVSKEERDAKVQTPILGNVTVFYNDSKPSENHPNTTQPPRGVDDAPNQAPRGESQDGFDDDIPW